MLTSARSLIRGHYTLPHRRTTGLAQLRRNIEYYLQEHWAPDKAYDLEESFDLRLGGLDLHLEDQLLKESHYA